MAKRQWTEKFWDQLKDKVEKLRDAMTNSDNVAFHHIKNPMMVLTVMKLPFFLAVSWRVGGETEVIDLQSLSPVLQHSLATKCPTVQKNRFSQLLLKGQIHQAAFFSNSKTQKFYLVGPCITCHLTLGYLDIQWGRSQLPTQAQLSFLLRCAELAGLDALFLWLKEMSPHNANMHMATKEPPTTLQNLLTQLKQEVLTHVKNDNKLRQRLQDQVPQFIQQWQKLSDKASQLA
eukprot:TRINITY_DN96556_c0_g1_i1.p2 TRINITY_DN96556_c0_g1~~TRINITY_DN96556_c0_g1_i1.p2  ORF type:complete len:232 (+),score=27.28 TRINITY_DN96556_c0_g1_i1:106-801(+)